MYCRILIVTYKQAARNIPVEEKMVSGGLVAYVLASREMSRYKIYTKIHTKIPRQGPQLGVF
jgi:hypothetical protein